MKSREVLGRVPTSKKVNRILVGDHAESTAWGWSSTPRLGLVPLLSVYLSINICLITLAFEKEAYRSGIHKDRRDIPCWSFRSLPQ